MRILVSSLALLGSLASPALALDAGQDLTDLIAPVEAIELTPGAEAGEKAGEFRFVLSFEPGNSAEIGLLRDKFMKDGIIAEVLDALSDQIALPADFPITFKQCDNINAWFSPSERSITFCYELIQLYNHGYEKVGGDLAHMVGWADQSTVLTGTTLHILLHEIGHGMVEIFDLPITGREEDAVDQFATLTLIAQDEEDEPFETRPSRLAMLGAVMFNEISTQPENIDRNIFADVHSLGQQRYFDNLCLLIGGNEEVYLPLIAPGMAMVHATYLADTDKFDEDKLMSWFDRTDALNLLPYQRVFNCSSEFARYDASWDYLIDNFMLRQPE